MDSSILTTVITGAVAIFSAGLTLLISGCQQSRLATQNRQHDYEVQRRLVQRDGIVQLVAGTHAELRRLSDHVRERDESPWESYNDDADYGHLEILVATIEIDSPELADPARQSLNALEDAFYGRGSDDQAWIAHRRFVDMAGSHLSTATRTVVAVKELSR